MTEAMREPENPLDSCKPKIIEKLKEYIEQIPSKKQKKKYYDFIQKALSANTEQIRFGKPPSYEKGYVYGNVTAKGWKHSGDTTYTRTISVDLQTPEYTFFTVNPPDNNLKMCKTACFGFSAWKHSMYSVRKDRFSAKRVCKVYLHNRDEAEALNDYAMDECDEKLWRLDYKLEDCRVNDYEYIQTQAPKDCNFYPVYLTVTNKKGTTREILIGCYNIDNNDMYCEIDFNDLHEPNMLEDFFCKILDTLFFNPNKLLPVIIIFIVIILLLEFILF